MLIEAERLMLGELSFGSLRRERRERGEPRAVVRLGGHFQDEAAAQGVLEVLAAPGYGFGEEALVAGALELERHRVVERVGRTLEHEGAVLAGPTPCVVAEDRRRADR